MVQGTLLSLPTVINACTRLFAVSSETAAPGRNFVLNFHPRQISRKGLTHEEAETPYIVA